MGIEQDDEKLINAAAQSFNNFLSAGLNIASLHKPKIKIEVNSAEADLQNTRQAFKEGWSIDRVKKALLNSPVAAKIKEKGNDVSNYVNSIVRKAKIDNEMEKHPTEEINMQRNRDRSLER